MTSRKYNRKEDLLYAKLAGLSENHKRPIASTLYLIEKDINEIERFIKDTPKGRIYKIINDLDVAQQELILETCKSLHEYINEYANALHLEVYPKSLGKIITSSLSVRWADACELEAKRLKGYGAIPQGGASILDSQAEKLMLLLNRLISLSSKGT